MKTIKLKSLSLVNFKGQRDLTIEFSEKETFVCGENATGKTTIFDSFLWLMFGKDSTGRSDSNFNIKTLDKNGVPVLHLEHSVTGVLDVDGAEVKLQRKYVEKWLKVNGSTEETLQNHLTQFFRNDVKLSTKKEYDAVVAEILPEDIAKMITNPFYFVSLPTDTQKDMLLDMSGNITDNEIAALDPSYVQLLADLNGRSMEQYTKEIASKKRSIKEELAVIPSQIDTANRLKPEAENWSELDSKLEETKKRVAEIDSMLADRSKVSDKDYEAKRALQDKIKDAKIELNKRENDLTIAADKLYSDDLIKATNEKNSQENRNKSALQEKINQINARKQEIQLTAGKTRNELLLELNKIQGELNLIEGSRPTVVSLQNQIKASLKREQERYDEYIRYINVLNKGLEALRKEYKTIFAETWQPDKNDFICPTCKRPLEAEDVEAKAAELTANYNQEKAERLKTNKDKGIKAATSLKTNQEAAEAVKREIETLNSRLIEAEEKLNDIDENIQLKKQTIISKQANIPGEPNYDAMFSADATIKMLSSEADAIKSIKINVIFPEEPNYEAIKEQDQICIDIKNKIVDLQNQLDNYQCSDVAQIANSNISALNQEKNLANTLIHDIITRQANKAIIERAEKEINDLEEKRISSNQALADLEKSEMIAFNFQRDKDKELLNRINGMFQIVSFKFESAQLNGGSKLTCICTVNGVPYPDVNAAGKLQAGIDIINAICTHKGISAPIFIDNREGVNQIQESVSQIINLCVTKDKVLTIKK